MSFSNDSLISGIFLTLQEPSDSQDTQDAELSITTKLINDAWWVFIEAIKCSSVPRDFLFAAAGFSACAWMELAIGEGNAACAHLQLALC